MLARSDEPSDAGRASAPAAEGGTRGDAFSRAQRHSRRVRVLKFAVPLLAVAIAVAFPVYSYLKAPLSVSVQDRKSTRLNSSHMSISYAVFCLKKKNLNSI